jgi:hypothetical protein
MSIKSISKSTNDFMRMNVLGSWLSRISRSRSDVPTPDRILVAIGKLEADPVFEPSKDRSDQEIGTEAIHLENHCQESSFSKVCGRMLSHELVEIGDGSRSISPIEFDTWNFKLD